jgi:hypothetical protein
MEMNNTNPEEIIVRQNDVMIGLLARTSPGTKTIRLIVTRGKRDPDAYVRLYNALDGALSVTECAKLAGVSPGTISPILRNWEEQGIVYDAGPKGKPLYKKLLLLPLKEA